MREFMRLLEPAAGYDGELGMWVAALEDVRRQLKEQVAELTAEDLAWTPPAAGNPIGRLLRHVAFAEADWILGDVCRIADPAPFLPEMLRAGGVMADPGPRPLAEFLGVLDAVRAETRKRLAAFGVGELDQRREYVGEDLHKVFTVRWILYHLVDHEAAHKGQIAAVRRMLSAR
ncbi:MAG: DUF664 domain-containing protein [Planctomycetes bacterium]|nr:DUF664 domain-containing protein [Planctomycetota bacterium]